MTTFLNANGIIAYLIGGYFLINGFAMDVGVAGYGPDPVANWQLMQIQVIHFMIAIGAILDGTLCFIGVAILNQLKTQTDRLLKGEKPEPEPPIYS